MAVQGIYKITTNTKRGEREGRRIVTPKLLASECVTTSKIQFSHMVNIVGGWSDRNKSVTIYIIKLVILLSCGLLD